MKRRLSLLVAPLALALATSACKERGTISVPLIAPCDGATATGVAIYLARATTCATLTCGLRDFDCSGDCIPLCADGYCTIDEATAGVSIEPAAAGDYALVMSYRYDGASTDQGIACFDLHLDADGTTSMRASPAEGERCCMP